MHLLRNLFVWNLTFLHNKKTRKMSTDHKKEPITPNAKENNLTHYINSAIQWLRFNRRS